MNNAILVFTYFLAVRVLSVFVVKTYFVPDEYWQSLEVAHKITFRYGFLTWEWVEGIRCYVYPMIIASVYKLLSIFSLDSANILILAPRILQAFLSAISDFRFYVWTGKKKWAVFLQITSWFWFYTASRTLANTLEASLTTIALSYYPWFAESSVYLWPAALCCYLRPTAIIIWVPLCLRHLIISPSKSYQLIMKRFIPIGILICSLCAAVDSYMYGKLIITPVEFMKYNLLAGIGSFYGTHPWYWYLTVGLPTVLGINFLPFLLGVVETLRNRDVYTVRKLLLITILLTIASLSAIEHKEFRFLLPILPMCLYICTDTLTRWSFKARKSFLWLAAIVILISNAWPAWYLSFIHQSGPNEVMGKLEIIAKTYKDDANNEANILFLMPCHSTPYYSHIHRNITMRFLTCEPNIHNELNYVDEADRFYKAPESWLRQNIPVYPESARPSHIVVFETLSSKVSEFLKDYAEIERTSHAEYFSERTGKHILIYEKLQKKNMFNNDEIEMDFVRN